MTEKSELVPVRQEVTVPAESPVAMVLAAMDRGATPEAIEKMLSLHERWEQNEARKAYNRAFASFKSEAVQIIRNVQISDGPLKGKRYANLFAVTDAVTPALSKFGLSASWKITKDEPSWIEITCTLRHELGHSESVSFGGPPDTGGAKNAIQARASTVSYLERYTLKMILGLADREEDDDGVGGREEGVSQDLLRAARDSAMEGQKRLKEFLKGLTERQRFQLEPESAALVEAAKAADKKGKPAQESEGELSEDH